jgi:hypothetical protein
MKSNAAGRDNRMDYFNSKHTNNKAMEQTDLRARRTAARLAFADHMNRFIAGSSFAKLARMSENAD